MRIVALILVVWLVIGAFATFQRGYFSNEPTNCAQLGTVLASIVAGPLNYTGVNPKIECAVPQPSR